MQNWSNTFVLKLNYNERGLITFGTKFLVVLLDSAFNWGCQTANFNFNMIQFLCNDLASIWRCFIGYSSAILICIRGVLVCLCSKGTVPVFIANTNYILKLHPRTPCRKYLSRFGFLTAPSLYFLTLVVFELCIWL